MRARRSLQEGIKEETVSDNGIRETAPLHGEVKAIKSLQKPESHEGKIKSHRVNVPIKKTTVMKSIQKRAEKKLFKSETNETQSLHEMVDGMEPFCEVKGTNSVSEEIMEIDSLPTDTEAKISPHKKLKGLEQGINMPPEDAVRAESFQECKKTMVGTDSPPDHKRLSTGCGRKKREYVSEKGPSPRIAESQKTKRLFSPVEDCVMQSEFRDSQASTGVGDDPGTKETSSKPVVADQDCATAETGEGTRDLPCPSDMSRDESTRVLEKLRIRFFARGKHELRDLDDNLSEEQREAPQAGTSFIVTPPKIESKAKKKTGKKTVQKLPLTQRRLIHLRNGVPFDLLETDQLEMDYSSIKINNKRKLDEIVDLNEGEQEMMNIWNEYIHDVHGRGFIHLESLLDNFVKDTASSILEKNLYRNFILFLTSLSDSLLIDSSACFKYILRMQSLISAPCRGGDVVAVKPCSPEPSSDPQRSIGSRSSPRTATTPSPSSNSPSRTPVRRRNAKRGLWSLGSDISASDKSTKRPPVSGVEGESSSSDNILDKIRSVSSILDDKVEPLVLELSDSDTDSGPAKSLRARSRGVANPRAEVDEFFSCFKSDDDQMLLADLEENIPLLPIVPKSELRRINDDMETTEDEISGTSPESVRDGAGTSDRTETDCGRIRQLANIENEPPSDSDGKTKRKGAKRSLESSVTALPSVVAPCGKSDRPPVARQYSPRIKRMRTCSDTKPFTNQSNKKDHLRRRSSVSSGAGTTDMLNGIVSTSSDLEA